MKKNEMTAAELERLITQRVEKDNKEALNALKAQQREELKNMRAELAKKKRQEYANLVKEVGTHLISKFDVDGHHNPDMQAADYRIWIDEAFDFLAKHRGEEPSAGATQ